MPPQAARPRPASTGSRLKPRKTPPQKTPIRRDKVEFFHQSQNRSRSGPGSIEILEIVGRGEVFGSLQNHETLENQDLSHADRWGLNGKCAYKLDQARSLIRGGDLWRSPPALSKSIHLLHKFYWYSHDQLSCVVDKFACIKASLRRNFFEKFGLLGLSIRLIAL